MNSHSKNVELKNVVREYVAPDKSVFRAVDEVSLEIHSGEFLTLLGPSGCGKTTTLRMIAGFEIPTSGEIYIDGENVSRLPPDKRDTAMVFQSYALFPHYDVYNNISFGLHLRGVKGKEATERTQKIMELVGLQGLSERFPNQLSGGQQQRVALARALVVEPGVLLFDEPLSNLDAKLRVSMRNEIKKIQKRLGLTSIYVTHDQSEAMALSDRIVIMNHGRIEQIGTPYEIYYHPASQFVADFIGRSNFIPCQVTQTEPGATRVNMFGAEVSISDAAAGLRKAGETVTVMARPESILIGREGLFPTQIQSSIFMGSFQEYITDTGGVPFVIEDYDFTSHETLPEGETARISFKPKCLHIL